MGLSGAQIAAIQGSWGKAKAADSLRNHGIALFCNMFATEPSWRGTYFTHLGDGPIDEIKKTDKFGSHAETVMKKLDEWISNLNDMGKVEASVIELAKSHVTINVKGPQFDAVKPIILTTMKGGLGSDFDGATEEAWSAMLGAVIDIIKANQ